MVTLKAPLRASFHVPMDRTSLFPGRVCISIYTKGSFPKTGTYTTYYY
jgi:hypothetical protein